MQSFGKQSCFILLIDDNLGSANITKASATRYGRADAPWETDVTILRNGSRFKRVGIPGEHFAMAASNCPG
jgi:hypothetical protein